MVLCVVHALYVGIRSLTLIGKSFTPTCFIRVSCHTIMFGRGTEKIGVMMEDNEEEEDDDNYVPPEYGDAATGEAAEHQEEPDDVPDDDLRWVIVDAKRQCKSEKEKLKFDRMLEDHKKGCTQIAKMATQSSVPHWICCNGRQTIVYLTTDLRSYCKY